MTQQQAQALQATYLEQLTQDFTEKCTWGSEPVSRLEYLGDYIFNFITYDSEMSELFSTKALEVCAAVTTHQTFEYIKDPEKYRWYLLMCNTPFFEQRLTWGTSIRGAWWDTSLELDVETIPTKFFSQDEWKALMLALMDFAKG